MTKHHIASFESTTRGTIDIYRGYDDATVTQIYNHSSDPAIRRTLGGKDLNRFAPDKFPGWIAKGGGRFMYTAWQAGNLAGLFWIGGESFPKDHFPDSRLQPPYTAAWRTAYSTPEGGTYEGEGIGKRLALAGIHDVVLLTKNGGPRVEQDATVVTLPPLAEAGLWIDTGVNNTDGQKLYHHLGNTSRDQQPVGFEDVGIYTPPPKQGATPLELEPRVGMIADSATIQRFVAAGAVLLNHAG